MLYNGYGKPIENTNGFFDVTYPEHPNLYDGSWFTGSIDNGVLNTARYTCFSTDYIDISGGEYVYVQTASSFNVNPDKMAVCAISWFSCAFYDGDKNYISGSAKTSTDTKEPLAVPDGAVYFRASWQVWGFDGTTAPNTSRYMIAVADDNTATTLPWEDFRTTEYKSAYLKHENLTNTDRPLHEGKKWLLFGDSLTDNYGGHDWQKSTSSVGGDGWKNSGEAVPWTDYFWASKIARELGLVLDNRAKGGSNINVGSNGNYTDLCGINILNAFLAEIDAGAEAPDFITVHFGSNAYMTQLGTVDDTSETTGTVCGAVKYFIEQIRTKCPNTVLGFVLPPQSDWGSNSTSKSVEQGRATIKSVLDLDEYSVPYVDLWKESGITVDMLPDGIHVSSKQANNLYYHAMRRFMMGL